MVRDFQTASSDRYQVLKELAKNNRNTPTEAKRMLWRVLKGKRFGVKFTRQHIIYDFIVDFVCLSKKLIIEVDGPYHCSREQTEKDECRTRILEELGFRVIRFTNEEVLKDTFSVIEKINEQIEYGK